MGWPVTVRRVGEQYEVEAGGASVTVTGASFRGNPGGLGATVHQTWRGEVEMVEIRGPGGDILNEITKEEYEQLFETADEEYATLNSTGD